MKKLALFATVAMAAVFISLLMCNSALLAQEVAIEECYRGVEVTNLAYYDTTMGAYVAVPVRCLPWWWDPLFLPVGWTLLTPAIVPVAFVDGCFFSGGVISFSSSEVRIVNARFEHFRGHIHGLRGEFRRNHDRGFGRARQEAHKKFGKDLKKSPPGFKHAGTRHEQPGHTGSKPGDKGKMGDHPGKSGPPTAKGFTTKAPPPAKAGTSTGKAGPPPKSAAPAPGIQKSPPPPKAGTTATKTGPPPPAAKKSLPPARAGTTGQGMGQQRSAPPPRGSMGMSGQQQQRPQMSHQRPAQQRPAAQPKQQQKSAPAQQKKNPNQK